PLTVAEGAGGQADEQRAEGRAGEDRGLDEPETVSEALPGNGGGDEGRRGGDGSRQNAFDHAEPEHLPRGGDEDGETDRDECPVLRPQERRFAALAGGKRARERRRERHEAGSDGQDNAGPARPSLGGVP